MIKHSTLDLPKISLYTISEIPEFAILNKSAVKIVSITNQRPRPVLLSNKEISELHNNTIKKFDDLYGKINKSLNRFHQLHGPGEKVDAAKELIARFKDITDEKFSEIKNEQTLSRKLPIKPERNNGVVKRFSVNDYFPGNVTTLSQFADI